MVARATWPTGSVWASFVATPDELRALRARRLGARSRPEPVTAALLRPSVRRRIDAETIERRNAAFDARYGRAVGRPATPTRAMVGAQRDPESWGTRFAEVPAASVDRVERDAAAAVLARASRFLGLGRHVDAGVAGWVPDVAITWYSVVDPDNPPGPEIASWYDSFSLRGFFDLTEPNAIGVRAGLGVRGVIETTAHELMHAAQLKRKGPAFYRAWLRDRREDLEDEARSFAAGWVGFYDRHPEELRRSTR